MSISHPNLSNAVRSDADVAVILAEQRRRWKHGQRISVEALCLEFQKPEINNDQRLDLIYQEVLLREQLGEGAVVEEYIARFPALAEELRLQFALDEAIQEKSADMLQVHRIATSAIDGDPVGRLTDDQSEVIAPALPVIEGYHVLHQVGQGGMAVVFKAQHLKLNRPVAIKLLRDHYGATATHVRRFLTEARAAARLQHPHIVQIYEVGQHDGRPFLAYEFLDGGTLSEHFKGQVLEPRLAAALCETLAKTLHFAHQQGVVHRDFKPANILLHRISDQTPPSQANSAAQLSGDRQTFSGALNGYQIKIADFGLAKLLESRDDSDSNSATQTGDILGTPAYMSPEQARGDASQHSAATDIYALGATLYELLTGRPPFVGAQPLDVLSQVIADDPVRPSQLVPRMPADLQTICLKCLEKSPDQRYASASDLADDLARYLSGEPIIARRISTIGRGWRWCRRNPIKSVVGTSLITLLILIAAVSSVYTVLLGQQLDLTLIAKRDEQTARIETLQQLWDARLFQAEAQRVSRREGQRYAALGTIDAARDLGSSILFPADQIDRMRNATIACLSRPDLRIVSQWPVDPSGRYNGRLTMDSGQSIFACRSQENDIVVLRVGDGFELKRLTECTSESSPILSPDGKHLAVIDERCRVFCLDASPPLLCFESDGKGAWSFTADSQKIVGTDTDGNLLIVDLQNGGHVKSFEIHTYADEIAVSPDLRKAAILTADSAKVIDLSNGSIVFQTEPPQGYIGGCRLAWHPDSTRISIGPYHGEGVVLWDIENGAKLRSFLHKSGDMTICFGSVGDLLLTYDHWSCTLMLWNANNGELELSETSIALSAILPDTTGGFAALRATEPSGIAALSIDHAPICRSLTLTQESQSDAWTFDLAYNADGRLLAVAASGEVRIFETETLASLGHLNMGSGYVQFEADDSLLTDNSLGLNRWRATVGSTADGLDQQPDEMSLLTFTPCEAISDEFSNACFDVNVTHQIVAVPNGDYASVWSTDLRDSKKSIGPHTDIRSVSVSADGRQLATGGWNGGKACIWDLDSGNLVSQIDEPDCCLVEFSPDGQWLITDAVDVTVRQTGTWRVETKLDVPGRSASGVKVCFSPDGRLLAVSDSMSRIHLFDTTDWHEIATLTDPNQRNAFRMAFNPAGTQLAIIFTPFDNRVFVWNLDAIATELRRRQLPWSIDLDSTSVGSGNSNRIGHVQFTPDARFVELAGAEQLRRAQRAAEKNDLVAARSAIQRTVKLQPQNALTCNNLAWLLATGPLPLRDPATAVELSRRAVEDQSLTVEQRSLYLNTAGVALFRASQIDEAIEMLNRSLRELPPEQKPFDLYFLSMCYARQGNQNFARRYFNLAEALVLAYSSQLPATSRTQLIQFAEESRSLLAPVTPDVSP